MASSRKSQTQIVLEYLQENNQLTTLYAREVLKVMSIAARIFELKEAGVNITTHWVVVGEKKIANYVLLSTAGEINHAE